MSPLFRVITVAMACALLAGCSGKWSTSSVNNVKPTALSATSVKKAPSQIQLTTGDITDRAYRVLGDINVTVNKTTIFNEDPTPAHVNEKLKEKAAEMGADAVILARYGTVGVGLLSWGQLDGSGRAITFQ